MTFPLPLPLPLPSPSPSSDLKVPINWGCSGGRSEGGGLVREREAQMEGKEKITPVDRPLFFLFQN